MQKSKYILHNTQCKFVLCIIITVNFIFMKKISILLVLLSVFIYIFYNTNIFYLLEKEKLAVANISTIENNKRRIKEVALTFDDGPSTNTIEILDILKSEDIKATFFVIGKHAKEYLEILLKVKEDGHQIANHSYSHSPKLHSESKQNILSEISKTENTIETIVGTTTRYFRPPYESLSYNMEKVLRDNNYKIVLWSVDPKDWDTKNNPEKIEQAVLKNIKDRSIILLHDSKDSTESTKITDENTEIMLKDLIKKIKSQGYKFVTVEDFYK